MFVESHIASLKLLKANLQQCGLLEKTEVYPGESRMFYQHAARNGLAFDIIFADPPYRDDSVSTLLPLLGQSVMILPHTAVILEHPTKHQIPPQVGPLNRVRQYRYGDTSLSLFQLADEKASC